MGSIYRLRTTGWTNVVSDLVIDPPPPPPPLGTGQPNLTNCGLAAAGLTIDELAPMTPAAATSFFALGQNDKVLTRKHIIVNPTNAATMLSVRGNNAELVECVIEVDPASFTGLNIGPLPVASGWTLNGASAKPLMIPSGSSTNFVKLTRSEIRGNGRNGHQTGPTEEWETDKGAFCNGVVNEGAITFERCQLSGTGDIVKLVSNMHIIGCLMFDTCRGYNPSLAYKPNPKDRNFHNDVAQHMGGSNTSLIDSTLEGFTSEGTLGNAGLFLKAEDTGSDITNFTVSGLLINGGYWPVSVGYADPGRGYSNVTMGPIKYGPTPNNPVFRCSYGPIDDVPSSSYSIPGLNFVKTGSGTSTVLVEHTWATTGWVAVSGGRNMRMTAGQPVRPWGYV